MQYMHSLPNMKRVVRGVCLPFSYELSVCLYPMRANERGVNSPNVASANRNGQS